MSHYKPYPAYHPSGIEWIGDVPSDWEVARIKRTATLRTDRCTDAPDGSQYIGLEDVESCTGQYRPTEGSARQNEDSTVGVFKSGDILYGKLRPYLKKAIVSDTNGVCSTEFLVLQPKTVLAPWLHQWLLTTGVTQQIEAGCEGTKMPRADWEHVGSIHVPSPDASEQAEIIAVLDRETKRIDSLIAKKTRFIELLKEKRQALITHAVTKGLDPDVKMRDSGVGWIGEVPRHWDVAPFKRWFSTVSGGTPDTSKQELYYSKIGGTPWLRTTDLTNGPVTTYEVGITEQALKDSACRLVPKDSVLVAMYGGEGTIGKNGLLKFQSSINQALCALLPCTAFDPEFTFYYIVFYREHWMVDAVSTRKDPNISQELIRSAPVVHPPLVEQINIVGHIRSSCDRINRLCKKTQHSIDLLKERRSAFITAAVTGQIDLREVA